MSSGQIPVSPSPCKVSEEAIPLGRRKRQQRKIKGTGRCKNFKPCNWDKEKLRKLLDGLVDLYPEIDTLNINDDGIVFSFTIRPEDILRKMEEKKGTVNPSTR